MNKALFARTAVAGVGLRQYKRGQSPLPERGALVVAIVDACADAGIDPSEIDGFVSYGDDKQEPTRLMPELGTKELSYAMTVFGGGGGGVGAAFGAAAGAILTGQANVVVVYRALVQGDSGRLSTAVMAHFLNPHYIGGGLVAPAQNCAMRAMRAFEHDGLPRSAAEALVEACYHHGARNPDAVAYGTQFTHEAYEASRLIAEPFHLLDCSRENDGAGALILVSAERARDLKRPPIYMLGAAQGSDKGWGELLENDDHYATAGFASVARRLWQQTGMGPKDVDCAQIYENFSAQAVLSVIDHGFCTLEEAGEFFRVENLTAPAGRLPINTGGGHIAQGFVHGINGAVESIRQLRGESANPVPGARRCLMAGGPGSPLVSSVLFGNEKGI